MVMSWVWKSQHVWKARWMMRSLLEAAWEEFRGRGCWVHRVNKTQPKPELGIKVGIGQIASTQS